MIGVLGGGAWGTALANLAATDGAPVWLWAREPDVAAEIAAAHTNARFLPGIALAASIRATTEHAALAEAKALLVAVPAQHVRAGLQALAGLAPRPLLLCAKGIEAKTGLLMSEVAAGVLPGWPLAVLSGPTFAGEVARGLPTAVTLAAHDPALGRMLTARLAARSFRIYASTDVVGAEIGGAVKNVLAVACGVVVGAALGENARAALLGRGFAEMVRFGVARGARPSTLAGLSGLGDLVLTCGSPQSRNFSLGIALGQGRLAQDVLAERETVAEGAATAPALAAAATALGVEMPIAAAVAALIAGAPAAGLIDRLLERPLRDET